MEAVTNLHHEVHGAIPEAPAGNPAIGAMILSFFGTTWLLLGCLCNSVGYDLAAVISALVGIVIFSTAYLAHARSRKQNPAKAEPSAAEVRRDRMFNRINIIQWVCAGVAALLLNVFGHPEWIMASIILVVGLHFFPLARLFQTPSHNLMGLALVFIALALPRYVADGPQSVTLPLATGTVLLVFALHASRRAWTSLRA